MDTANLTRFCIPNLKQELIENLVPMGRHSEIINFHEKYLNDDQYYCLSPYNPVKPKGLHWIYGPSTRHYVCGGVSQYFVASSIEIEGVVFNAIIQKIHKDKVKVIRAYRPKGKKPQNNEETAPKNDEE